MPALAALAVVTLIHLGARAVAPGGMVADVTQCCSCRSCCGSSSPRRPDPSRSSCA
uniref:Uncharacterized protein n=1 Tax=Janibacter limosus TaxID=53458 RepID=A0AC61U3Y7_9MICO|nr:hypothetical protein [Janibacter limosus]